jgi:hypothetical protein
MITLASTTIANGVLLTVGAGVATPVTTATIAGAGLGTSDITFNTTATVTVNGAIGANIGTLTNANAAGTIDVQGNDFTFGTLANAGIFRLTGAQTTQSIGAINFTGIVQYYGPGGVIRVTVPFNSLDIAGGGTFTLGLSIQVGPTPPLIGTGFLSITSGTLDVSTFDITVNGDWNNVAGNANFVAQTRTVFFVKPGGPINISGDNTWFIFDCQVPNITINFQAGKTQAIANILGAIFRVKTTAGNNINIFSSVPGSYWQFTLNPLAALDMAYVTVDWSNAIPFDVPVLPNVFLTAPAPVHCPGWKNVNRITADVTVDMDHNGKIDRILVTAQFSLTKTPLAFSGFVVQVPGYTLTTNGGDAGTVYNWTNASLGPNQFWIMLVEQPFLDTGALPAWTVVRNTTLNDSAFGTYYVPTGAPFSPLADTAPPIVGYTLAVSGTNQLFIHFSELVYHGAGLGPLVLGDFTFNTGVLLALSATAITPVTLVGNGISEAVITLSRALTGDDLTLPVIMEMNPANVQDGAGNALTILLAPSGHRISDIGLGLLSNGLIEPVFAHDETQSGPFPGGIGLIKLGGFDGTKWLRNKQNITLEGAIQTLTNGYPANGTGTNLRYDLDVPASMRFGNTANGIWVPSFTDNVTLSANSFSGLVPTGLNGNTQARTLTELGSSTYPKLRDFMIPGTESKDHDGAVVDFLFQMNLAAQTLYTARVVDPAAIDWYRHITPWTFDLRDIRTQRGGVQILKNVINPDKGDVTTLQFVQSSSGNVTVTVFDLSGSIIRVLVRQNQAAGDYGVTWDGTNRSGAKVTRGLYFIRIVGPGMDEIRKVLVVR